MKVPKSSLSLSMALTMIIRSVGSLYSQLWLALRANVRGPWSLPCLANSLHHAERTLQVFPVQASCRLERTGPVPAVRNGVVSQSRQKSFAGAPFAVMLFCWFVGCCCFGLGEDQLSICVGALFFISSLISDFISSFSSRCFFFLCLLCRSSFFLFFFFLSCSSLLLFLYFSISFSLGQFLTWTQQYFHTLYSH